VDAGVEGFSATDCPSGVAWMRSNRRAVVKQIRCGGCLCLAPWRSRARRRREGFVVARSRDREGAGSIVWSAAATTPLWLLFVSACGEGKAVSPSRWDSATALHRALPPHFIGPAVASYGPQGHWDDRQPPNPPFVFFVPFVAASESPPLCFSCPLWQPPNPRLCVLRVLCGSLRIPALCVLCALCGSLRIPVLCGLCGGSSGIAGGGWTNVWRWGVSGRAGAVRRSGGPPR